MSNRSARRATLASRRSAKSYKKTRISRGIASTVTHSYKRTVGTGAVVGTSDGWRVNSQAATGLSINGGAGSGGYDIEISFQLSGVTVYFGGIVWWNYPMPNFADLTALYDNYRVDFIDCEFTFNSDNSSTSQPAASLPRVFMVEDHDDVAAINLTGIQQVSGLKKWQFGIGPGVMKRVRIHPTPLEMVYYSAVATGYQRGSNKKWIRTTNDSVPLYGVKMIIDPIVYTAGSVVLGDIAASFTYHITCTDTK